MSKEDFICDIFSQTGLSNTAVCDVMTVSYDAACKWFVFFYFQFLKKFTSLHFKVLSGKGSDLRQPNS
jgi:hypothetical protein